MHENADGVPAADGVAVLLDVRGESGRVAAFDKPHPEPVQLLHGLVNGASSLVVVCKAEPLPPVAEIRADDKQVSWVIDVVGQSTPVRLQLQSLRVVTAPLRRAQNVPLLLQA